MVIVDSLIKIVKMMQQSMVKLYLGSHWYGYRLVVMSSPHHVVVVVMMMMMLVAMMIVMIVVKVVVVIGSVVVDYQQGYRVHNCARLNLYHYLKVNQNQLTHFRYLNDAQGAVYDVVGEESVWNCGGVRRQSGVTQLMMRMMDQMMAVINGVERWCVVVILMD